MPPVIATTYHAPLGDIELTADERGLTGLWFAGEHPSDLSDAYTQAAAIDPFAERIEGADAESGSLDMSFEEQCNAAAVGVIERAWAWLNSYFAGQAPLWIPPLHLEGDELSHEVWTALLAVPYGETVTCDELADRISARGAVVDGAAIAAVLSSSPISLVVPVHRVSDGSDFARAATLRLWESRR